MLRTANPMPPTNAPASDADALVAAYRLCCEIAARADTEQRGEVEREEEAKEEAQTGVAA